MNKAAKIHQDNISHKHPIELFQIATPYLEDSNPSIQFTVRQ